MNIEYSGIGTMITAPIFLFYVVRQAMLGPMLSDFRHCDFVSYPPISKYGSVSGVRGFLELVRRLGVYVIVSRACD
jgi:hypothetical protein